MVDIRGEGSPGLPALERVRAKWSAVSIFAVAGSSEPDVILQAMRAGANEFFAWSTADESSSGAMEAGLHGALGRIAERLVGARDDDAGTKAEIARLHAATGILVDPHSAIGVAAGRARRGDAGVPMIALATAHPSKFPEAVERATGVRPELPAHLAGLYDRPERCQTLPNDLAAVMRYIRGAVDTGNRTKGAA